MSGERRRKDAGAPPPGLTASRGRVGDRDVVVFSFPVPPAAMAGLTPAQQAVAEMAAAGCSNAEIAARRGTSPATVARQLSAVYERLGVSSRAELVALRYGRPPP